MDSDIFIERDGEFIPMTETAYRTEAELQELLERNSGLLAGRQMAGEPLRFALVKREAGVPDAVGGGDRWSLDHLFIDQYAVPTLVEVKRSTDTRIRREVVGQMLDYAANAALHWADERLSDDFTGTCRRSGVDPAVELMRLLGDQSEDVLPEATDARIDQFWQQASSNLRSGRVRLLFVADVIPPELRRIIEFLNERMSPTEVLGVEIQHYTGGDLRLVVPTVIGRTAVAEQVKGRSVEPGLPLSEVLASSSEPVRRAVELLRGWATANGVDVVDLPKSIRYSVEPRGWSFAYLYPAAQYQSLYFELGPLEGSPRLASLREAMAAIRGTAVNGKSVSLSCAKVVDHWDALSQHFLPLILAEYRALA